MNPMAFNASVHVFYLRIYISHSLLENDLEFVTKFNIFFLFRRSLMSTPYALLMKVAILSIPEVMTTSVRY